VKDGLPDIDNFVSRTCHAVWYARSSPMKLVIFIALLMRALRIVGLNIYNMLVAEPKHEKTFEELSFQDQKYANELTKKGKGVPTQENCKPINLILKCLDPIKLINHDMKFVIITYKFHMCL
jgi:hypothetical protein